MKKLFLAIALIAITILSFSQSSVVTIKKTININEITGTDTTFIFGRFADATWRMQYNIGAITGAADGTIEVMESSDGSNFVSNAGTVWTPVASSTLEVRDDYWARGTMAVKITKGSMTAAAIKLKLVYTEKIGLYK